MPSGGEPTLLPAPVGAGLVGGFLEVALDDAQVDGVPCSVLGCLRADGPAVGAQRYAEMLVVHGGGGQLRRLHGQREPFRRLVAFDRAELGDRLGAAGRSLRLPVADGDADAQRLAGGHACVRLLARDERHPAGVEPQRLRRQHQALPPIAHRLVLRAPVGDERDMGGGAAHEANACDKLEHLGVVEDDLDVQPALADALVDDHQQRGHRAAVDGLVAVRAHRMACADDVHDAGLIVHANRLWSKLHDWMIVPRGSGR